VKRISELGTTLRVNITANVPDGGGETFPRNIGFYKSHMDSHPRKTWFFIVTAGKTSLKPQTVKVFS
jgi:hypothetical protein